MTLQIAVMQSGTIPAQDIAAELKGICAQWQIHCRCRIVSLSELRALYVKSNAVDLLVLDADVQEAVTFADMLRRSLGNHSTQILFVAKTPFSALQLFASHPLHFLLLPVKTEALRNVMLTYALLDYRCGCSFTYHVGRRLYRISRPEICYITAEGRKLTLVTEHHTVSFYALLKQAALQLNNPYFYLLSNTLLVNLHQISRIEETLLIMNNQDRLPLAEGQQQLLLERCAALQVSC